MTKLRYTYGGYTPAQLKSRSSIPDAGDITENVDNIGCDNISAYDVATVLSSLSRALEDLCPHANVNEWSWFGPTIRSIVSQELVNAAPTANFSLESFAGYNHSAPTPEIKEGGGAGGSKSYDYEGTDLLVRVRVDLGEINWPSFSADITHAYIILSYSSTEYFTLEYELTTLGEQFIGATIDFGISADRAYSCAFWFGKPTDKKVLKFPGFPSFTINAVYAVPPDVEVTSVDAIADGTIDDRINVSFDYTNSGGPGSVTIYWEMYNSSNVKIDEGNQSVAVVAGSSGAGLAGLVYPSTAGAYTLRVKETDDASWEVSNTFNVT